MSFDPNDEATWPAWMTLDHIRQVLGHKCIKTTRKVILRPVAQGGLMFQPVTAGTERVRRQFAREDFVSWRNRNRMEAVGALAPKLRKPRHDGKTASPEGGGFRAWRAAKAD